MEMIAREQEQAQPQDGEEQAGPYPIEQLQVSMPLGCVPGPHQFDNCISTLLILLYCRSWEFRLQK